MGNVQFAVNTALIQCEGGVTLVLHATLFPVYPLVGSQSESSMGMTDSTTKN